MLKVVWPPALAALVMAGVLLPVEAALDAEAHAVAVSLALLLGQALAGLAVFVVVLRLCPATRPTSSRRCYTSSAVRSAADERSPGPFSVVIPPSTRAHARRLGALGARPDAYRTSS